MMQHTPLPVTWLLSAFLVYAGAPLSIGADPARKAGDVEMKDVASHEELSRALRMDTQNDPIRKLGPAIGNADEDPAAVQPNRDFIENSVILCYQGRVTFIPKDSVLHIPSSLEDRIGIKPDADVVTWDEFYPVNLGWIRSIEVTREQALGKSSLPEAKRKAVAESSSVIVATYKERPISVLPHEEAQGEKEEDNPKEN